MTPKMMMLASLIALMWVLYDNQVRDNAFADEDDKFVEFVAEDLERGQVNPRVLEKINGMEINDDPERKKTRKEAFQDLIRKSKHEKMVRQKGQAEQREKVKQLDDLFGSLFPALTIADDRFKPKNDSTKQYDSLRSELIFEPTMPPEHPKSEGKDQAAKAKRKQVNLPDDDKDADHSEEEREEDAMEEGEEEEYEEYEAQDEDLERLQEKEVRTRKFNEGHSGKKDKLEENCGKTIRNLKLLGELEDQLLEEFVRGMNDEDLDGGEEGEEEFYGDEENLEGEEEFADGEDECGEEELEEGEDGEEEEV